MARQYRTGLIITGDASGGIRAVRATEKELGQLNRGFDRGSKRSQNFARNVGGTSRELQVLRRGAAMAATALAGVFAVRSLQGQIDFADQLQKTQLRIGASTEALSQYNYVANLSGVQFGQLTTAWQRQTRRIAQATQGTGEAVKALDALGLSAAELNQLQPEEQFERIAAAMQGVENQGQRTALAMQLWDTEGVSLLQIVNQGTDAIAAMRAEADRLGLTISQQTANNMAAFTSEIDRVKFAAQGLTTTMLADLVPAMTEGLQTTNAWVEQLGGAEVILERVAMVAGTLATVYLAHRLGPALNAAGATGLRAGRTIAEGMYIATGATGRLNQALVLAQGRIVAMSAAGRALRGTLALVGGPAGAAILAAGAIYHFREELGLTQQRIGLTEEQLVSLRAELAEMSGADLSRSLDDLNGALDEAILKAAAAREELAALRAEGNRGSGALGFGGGQVGAELRGMQAVAEAEQRIAEIEDRRIATRGALNEKKEEGSRIARRSVEIANAQAEASKEAAKAADEFARSLQTLQDRLYPIEAQQRQYREEQAILTQAWNEGAISADRYTEAMRRLEQAQLSQQAPGQAYGGMGFGSQIGDPLSGMGSSQQVGQQDYWGRWLESAETAFTDFDQLAANTAENFQRGFGSAFESMIFDSQSLGDSLRNLADGMARSMIRALGEMAAQWLAYQAVQLAVGSATQASAATAQSLNAAAMSQMAGLNAFASTAAIPIVGPAMAPAAMAAAIAATAPVAATVSTLSMAGIAHAGIDSIPREGTWLLDRGERVVDNRTNQDLKQYLERENRQAAQQSGGGSITIHAPITVQAQPGMSNQDAQRQGSMMGQALRTEVLKIMQDQKRPGGVLAKN